MELQKATNMNLLIEFYGVLLTPKQLEYIELYYADNYSLGEIADEFDVSRQAVYDTIRRTESTLEKYEEKLHMVSDFYTRQAIYDQMEEYVFNTYQRDATLLQFVEQLQENNK